MKIKFGPKGNRNIFSLGSRRGNIFILAFIFLYAIFLTILRYYNVQFPRAYNFAYDPEGVLLGYFLFLILPILIAMTIYLVFVRKKN